MKKSRSTRSHFTHARSCSRALNRVPSRAKRPAFIRTYSLWKRRLFPFARFTGYKKSNQNQFGRALPFAFALKCNRIYLLFSSLSDFDSFRWRVHLSYGVCGLRARVQLKTLSSLLKTLAHAIWNKRHVNRKWLWSFFGGGGGEEVRWKTVRTYGKILATPLICTLIYTSELILCFTNLVNQYL